MRKIITKANINFILGLIFIFLLSFICSFFFQWWVISLVPFCMLMLLPQKPFRAFLTGFISVFLLWSFLVLYLNNLNQNILSKTVCTMFFNFYVPYLLEFLTAMTGGFVAGMSALVASHGRDIIKRKINTQAEPIRFHTNQTPLTTPIALKQIITTQPIAEGSTMMVKQKNITAVIETTTTEMKNQEKSQKLTQNNLSIIKPTTTNNSKNVSVLKPSNKMGREEDVQPIQTKPNVKVEVTDSKPTPIKVKPTQKKAEKLAIPKSSSPFKVPSIKEQTERNAALIKKKLSDKK